MDHCHPPCRFDHFDAVAEDLQMDSTESLLQTNSLLHESWQVVQDQVSSAVLTLVVPCYLCRARSAAVPLACPLRCTLQRGGSVCDIWC